MNHFDFKKNEDENNNDTIYRDVGESKENDKYAFYYEKNLFVRFVEKLRSRSDNIKRRILIISTFSITALIAIIWFLVFWNKEVGMLRNTNKETERKDIVNAFDSFGGILKDLEERGQKILDVFSTTTNDIATTSSSEFSDSEILDSENITQDISD